MIVVGALSVGTLAFATFFTLNKDARVKNTSSALAFDDDSPRKTSKRMVKALCMNYFSLHTLTNRARRFNDRARLEGYTFYIRNPSVIACIKDVKGRDENE
jgi:hypothetical protein